MFGFDDFGDFDRPRKKRRLGLDPHQIVSVHEIDVRSFDDPERYTAKLAARVVLDLNDPQLLVEEVDPEALKAKVRPGEKVVAVRRLRIVFNIDSRPRTMPNMTSSNKIINPRCVVS